MATEDDEIYSDTPSSESVRDVRLIRKMFEVETKSENPVQGKSAKPTARGINGIVPKPPAKQHPVPGTTGNKGGTPPAVPSKTAAPPKATTTSKVVPPPSKNTQKSSVTSTDSLGTSGNSAKGAASSVPDKGIIRPVPHNGTSSVSHSGTSGDKNLLQSVLRRNKPSVTPTTPSQPLKIPSDLTRISGLSGDRSTVYPPNGIPSVSDQRYPSIGSAGYSVVSPHKQHPKSPLAGKISGNPMTSSNKKTYRKLPVPMPRTPAPRKKPLPPGLPRDFAQKFMADMRMGKKGNVEAKTSTERDSELLAYDDIYEDVCSYVN